jgi:hypothetical protein
VYGDLADVSVEATFIVPGGNWNHGFLFRNNGLNELHAVVLDSYGRWIHHVRTGSVSSGSNVRFGFPGINMLEGTTNHLRVIAIGLTGFVYVNGDLVGNLDLSAVSSAGWVSAAAGIFSQSGVGKSTIFANFTVRALD